jgi:hypothetical protein
LTAGRKKPVAVIEEEPITKPVIKVVRQVHFEVADSIEELEVKINEFLPKLSYNDLTEPAVEVYLFKDKYVSKTEYDLRIKPT